MVQERLAPADRRGIVEADRACIRLVEVAGTIVEPDQSHRRRAAVVRAGVETLRPYIGAHQRQTVPVPDLERSLKRVVRSFAAPFLKTDRSPLREWTPCLDRPRSRRRIVAALPLLQPDRPAADVRYRQCHARRDLPLDRQIPLLRILLAKVYQ